jgi:AcrR family transcriptional regulator
VLVQTVDVTLSDTQEQILDATMSCIVRDGIEGASLRNVAREADVSLGLLSYHFDDKRSLIEAAFRRATDRLFDATTESLSDVVEPDDAVMAYVRGAFTDEFLTSDYLALRLALWAIARTDDEIAAVERHLYERYALRLAELIRAARPTLDDPTARERATDVIVTQNGLWLNWARHHDRPDLERGLARCDAIALAD